MQITLPSLALLFSSLAVAQNTNSSLPTLSAYEQIRNTLATEAFLLDTRDLTKLGQVYADDGSIQFADEEPHVGVANIIAFEQEALNNTFTLVHTYVNSLITFNEDGTANATSYATWNKLGNVNDGYFQQTWAKYFDNLVETDGTWKFQTRTVQILFGPLSSNLTDGGL
ncbi:hypothetical protein J7T55_009781 [Diaporthe amygdali]|uniref:uncharacterized protein n=1 Tax=Phomopsis amygdali TaxID=1214568 RepID=UPI0022FDC307|nr:uncharacterized protein J7T55_009781 [Diaporthe amygdali]KAJ0116631.1 hypothetical protein J7T55_009781 [Diaporthe amygdali]